MESGCASEPTRNSTCQKVTDSRTSATPLRQESDDPRIPVVHRCCLLDDRPEIGRGLNLAREYGVADLDESGQWVVGDLSRLDPS